MVDVEGHDDANRGTRARFLWPCEAVDRLPLSDRPRVVRAARWRHAARRALDAASPAWTSLRAAAHADCALIPFQLEPALALVHGDASRFLLADAVGLGKTIQAGLMIAETLCRWPATRVLIVAPSGLRQQWSDELLRRFRLSADVLDAAGIGRLTARLPHDVNPWSIPAIVVTSIDYVKRPEVMRSLETLVWDLVVFDEAHGLTGRSDRAAAAAALAGRARTLVMLTATPHSGEDEMFTRLCGIGTLDDDDPLLVFQRTRADAGIAGGRRTVLLRVRPTDAERAMHEALMAYARRVWVASADTAGEGARLAMSVLARRACSSASALAQSLERRIALLEQAPLRPSQLDLPLGPGEDLDEEPQAVLGVPGLHDARDERAHLDSILLLAREAARSESKPAALRRLFARTHEPAIVFTEYRDTLQHLAQALPGLSAVQLHGGLTPRERAEALRRFVEEDTRLLLATDAASEGLNLHQRCRLVINLELPWTPLRLEQRAGRVDRIGQPSRPHAIHLVAGGTSEETVLTSLVQRQARIRTAMDTLRPPVPERQIAEWCMTGGAIPPADDATPCALPEGVRWLDRRREAQDEAARLESARRFVRADAIIAAEGRPPVTRLSRRSRSSAVTCLWAIRLILTDRDGRVLLDTLIGAAGEVAPRHWSNHPASVRALLTLPAAMKSLTSQATIALTQQLQRDLEAPLARWLRRERSLADRITRDHARLAAGLLQRGLFDRRADRQAARQQSLLDEALSRSRQKQQELAARASVHPLTDLAFAVVLG